MSILHQFKHLDIAWNLTPEHAVTMYLEWGNNDWNSEYPPVRSKLDISNYFIVDTWGTQGPVIRLVRRNSEKVEDLISFPLPETFLENFKKEHGKIKGIFAPTPEVKTWLKQQVDA